MYAFDNDFDHSPIGREFIIMPRLKGRPLNLEMKRLYQNKDSYHHVLEQLADIIVQLKNFNFSHIGNFAPLENDQNELEVAGIVDFAGYQVENPCALYSDYEKHALKYYTNELERMVEEGCVDADLYQMYIPILKDLITNGHFDSLDSSDDQFVFSHQDFVMKNILVDGDVIAGILDWEWSGSTLKEIEPMTRFDFLISEEDRLVFADLLSNKGLPNFFNSPTQARKLFYQLIGNVYSLVAFREWGEGKLEHTAKFLAKSLNKEKYAAIRVLILIVFALKLLKILTVIFEAFK